MSAEALRGVILVSAWPGTGRLLVDAGRWTVGVRVASYVIYTLMTVLAVQTL
nr:MAG: hypothetical protein [Bacteriophage sp.]